MRSVRYFVALVAKAKKPDNDALGIRLEWPETEPARPIDRPRLRHPGADAIESGTRRRSRRKALPAGGASSPPADAGSQPTENGVADSLERFTERVAVLAEAVDGLRNQLAEHSRQVAGLATDVSDRLGTLQEAAEEVGRVRAVLAEQPRGELERQMTELVDEVKAARRSVAVSSGKRKSVDTEVVDRIVRSVLERLSEQPPAPKGTRARRSSAAG